MISSSNDRSKTGVRVDRQEVYAQVSLHLQNNIALEELERYLHWLSLYFYERCDW